MNRKTIVSLFGLAAFAAVLPTAASARSSVSISIGTGGYYSGYGDNQYGYQGYDPYRGNDRNYRHQRQHGELEDEHGDNHDDLDGQHEEAHEQGLSRREHRYLLVPKVAMQVAVLPATQTLLVGFLVLLV